MSIVQTINLNLIPNSGPILVKCDQYDAGEGRIVAKLYDGDTAYTPAAGATAIIQGKKPDGNGFMYDATLSGNTVTADLTNQMSVVAGRVFVQFVITESDNRTGTFVFFLDVQPSALPADTEMSTSEYQVIEELLETAQAINENFPYIGPNGHWFYYDVEQGQYVDSGVAAGTSITIGTTTTLDAGDDATVTNTGDNINAVFNFGIPKGEKGDDGEAGTTPVISMSATADATSSPNPSVNVTKTGTDEAPNFALAFSGLKGAQGVQGEEGPEGPAGNGIVSITKTGTSGLVDTYTILFTNGQSTTFTVTNGQDGTGSGDMTKTVYDSTNAVADAGGIAAYVAAHAATGDFVSLKGVTDISSWTELKTFNIGNYYYKGDASTKFSDAPTGIPSKNAMSLSMAVRRFDDVTNKVFQELVLGYTSSSPDEKYIRKFFRVGNRGLNDVWSDWKEVAYTDDIPDITGKADKVSGATNGDLAGLDSNGNLTDSGSKASDFATASSVTAIEGKIPSTASSINKMATASDITDVYEVMGQNGAKNLARYPYAETTLTRKGITYTDNGNGSITANGTASANSNMFLYNHDANFLPAGKYKVSFTDSGASDSTYYLRLILRNSQSVDVETNFIYNDEVEFTITDAVATIYLDLRVMNGVNLNGKTFYPMIRLASYPDNTYQPPTMTNQELTSRHTSKLLSTATGTYTSILTQFYNEYYSHPRDVRPRMWIALENNNNLSGIFKPTNPSIGSFSQLPDMSYAGNVILRILRLDTKKALEATIDTNGNVTYSDLSNTTSAFTFKLYLD